MIRRLITQFFFALSPIVLYTISGKSMAPAYKEGNTVFAIRTWLRPVNINDCIIVKDSYRSLLLCKRVKKIVNNSYYILGDNKQESTDSRHFGWIEKKNIIAIVFYKINN